MSKQPKPIVSIVIPVYNEALTIHKLLGALQKANDTTSFEVVIVDGGSTDTTREIVKQHKNVRIVATKKPQRARQMNAGAHVARGSILFFLHADTLPPENFIHSIVEAAKGFDAGSFRLRFDSSSRILRFVCWFTRFRNWHFHFGDQGLFVKKAVFRSLGGYNEELSIMEDQDICKRLSRKNCFGVIDDYVTTSARKYKKIGVMKLQSRYALICMAYWIGFSNALVEKMYYKLK